jgi:hypothetical protein
MRKLANSLNRLVFIASPAFFGDETAHECVLTDIESAGLWLRGDAVRGRLHEIIEASAPENAPADVFIPFDQIICVFDPTHYAFLARGVAAPEAAANPHERPPPAAQGRHRYGRSKYKTSKRTR